MMMITKKAPRQTRRSAQFSLPITPCSSCLNLPPRCPLSWTVSLRRCSPTKVSTSTNAMLAPNHLEFQLTYTKVFGSWTVLLRSCSFHRERSERQQMRLCWLPTNPVFPQTTFSMRANTRPIFIL